jgi:hypothetical protein
MGYTIWPDGPTGDILARVHTERYRQDDLKAQGKFPWSCADKMNPDTNGQDAIKPAEKLAVLAEEFGEVSSIVCKLQANRDEAKAVSIKKLQKELIEVAAVCVAWAESLEP